MQNLPSLEGRGRGWVGPMSGVTVLHHPTPVSYTHLTLPTIYSV